MFFAPREFKLPFIKKEQIANDTYSFYFDRSSIPFDFLAGQYIRIILPFTDDIYTSRFFTIASSPFDKTYLTVSMKRGKSEFKKSLFALQPQEMVQLFGPNGGVYFNEEDATDCVFLAGGLGIVPFYSMIKYVAAKKLSTKMILIVSFSYPQDCIYYDELLAIARGNHNIQVIYTITRDVKEWQGETGRISEKLIRRYVLDLNKPTYSIVGFPEMVSDTEELLESMGVPLEKIKIEPFTGY